MKAIRGMKVFIVTLRLALLATLLAACSEPVPHHREFRVGETRAAIAEQFGSPERITQMVKRSDAVWGPIEEFWDQVPAGAQVDIWIYRSVNESGVSTSGQNGETQLYFVDGSSVVNGIGFGISGAVYESSGSN